MTFPVAVDSVLNTIRRTPLVRLTRLAPAGGADVFVKLEYFTPTGSCKDRMALAMIEGAEARGALRPGMRVIEYTGGSTGSCLAMLKQRQFMDYDGRHAEGNATALQATRRVDVPSLRRPLSA